jgi:hypothetical protein
VLVRARCVAHLWQVTKCEQHRVVGEVLYFVGGTLAFNIGFHQLYVAHDCHERVARHTAVADVYEPLSAQALVHKSDVAHMYRTGTSPTRQQAPTFAPRDSHHDRTVAIVRRTRCDRRARSPT